jgi:MYXO-CTERM domain-containing protein
MHRLIATVIALLGLFIGGACANTIDYNQPSATVTLDNNAPTAAGGHYNWTYTLTVTGADLNSVQSFELFDVGGVIGATTPNHSDWYATVQPVNGGGVYDVTFTNDNDPCGHNGCSLDGFTIESKYNAMSMANYTVSFGDGHHDDPVVGAPTTVPEPASLGMAALALVMFGGAALVRRQRALPTAR